MSLLNFSQILECSIALQLWAQTLELGCLGSYLGPDIYGVFNLGQPI